MSTKFGEISLVSHASLLMSRLNVPYLRRVTITAFAFGFALVASAGRAEIYDDFETVNGSNVNGINTATW